MSADFWAGYISGAVGILIGNPLDLIKVRLQGTRSPPRSGPVPAGPAAAAAHTNPAPNPSALARQFLSASTLLTGTAAPILGYGALNALLFVSYNSTEALLNRALLAPDARPVGDGRATGANLWTTWLAGAVGGLATWFVSTPTELVKCRAQMASAADPGVSSLAVARAVWRAEGLRGFYFGGAVTAMRDSVGYGFYFWSYELCRQYMAGASAAGGQGNTSGMGGGGGVLSSEAARVLLCGGVAGVVTWVSIFPLDVIKTRVQTQAFGGEVVPLLGSSPTAGGLRPKRLGAVAVAREAYREGGVRVFFRGLGVCSVRAFMVNAVQWAAYEWIMAELGQGRRKPVKVEV